MRVRAQLAGAEGMRLNTCNWKDSEVDVKSRSRQNKYCGCGWGGYHCGLGHF